MAKRHKTLETYTERAERKGSAGNDKWYVTYDENKKSYKYYHWNTLVLHIENGSLEYFFGISRSDADGLNAMCELHGVNASFTHRPVNGGFMKIA